jgi:hypothetical protein
MVLRMPYALFDVRDFARLVHVVTEVNPGREVGAVPRRHDDVGPDQRAGATPLRIGTDGDAIE